MARSRSEWKSLLTSHLEEAKLPSCFARLKWLCSHMDEYLERFVGFVKLGTVPIAKLVDGDLFVIIRVAVEVIDEKLIQEPRINQSIREQWTEFKNTIIWMQRAQDASDTELILETYQRFKSSLMALEE
jgi:hypothetical protein